MTKSALAEIAIKVWAITFIVRAAMASPFLVIQVAGVGLYGSALELLDFGFPVLIAIVLLWTARPISRRLARPDEAIEVAGSLQRTAFGCLGLYFAVVGLADCIGFLAARGNNTQQLTAGFVQAVAGVAIVLGRRLGEDR